MALVVGEVCLLFSNTVSEVTNPEGLHVYVFLRLSCDHLFNCLFFWAVVVVCCLCQRRRGADPSRTIDSRIKT